ncbi:hypothetical protein HD554DRAFT_2098434 [Boletus coccyginus]|nr:hypothetical protein HD554DRAFT_2098434 [Boletus coccyginus]
MDIADVIRTVGTTSGVRALVFRTFIFFLERSTRKVIVNISSALEDDLGSQHTTYSISKMGLNILTVQTYKQLKEWPDLITFAIWCKTIALSNRHVRWGL